MSFTIIIFFIITEKQHNCDYCYIKIVPYFRFLKDYK